jgi:hypothetical protein
MATELDRARAKPMYLSSIMPKIKMANPQAKAVAGYRCLV